MRFHRFEFGLFLCALVASYGFNVGRSFAEQFHVPKRTRLNERFQLAGTVNLSDRHQLHVGVVRIAPPEGHRAQASVNGGDAYKVVAQLEYFNKRGRFSEKPFVLGKVKVHEDRSIDSVDFSHMINVNHRRDTPTTVKVNGVLARCTKGFNLENTDSKKTFAKNLGLVAVQMFPSFLKEATANAFRTAGHQRIAHQSYLLYETLRAGASEQISGKSRDYRLIAKLRQALGITEEDIVSVLVDNPPSS